MRRDRSSSEVKTTDDWMVDGPNLDAWGRALRRTLPRRVAGHLAGFVGVPARLPSTAWDGTYLFVSERTRRAAERAGRPGGHQDRP